MACGGCRAKAARRSANRNITEKDGVMGGYKYLNDRQIKARLEIYKRKYCQDCDERFKCDYSMYVGCKKNK
jgi:hypothetical protein